MKHLLLVTILFCVTSALADNMEAVSSLQAIQRSCAQLLNSPVNTAVLKGLPKLSKTIDDEDMKVTVLAIYAMGMFYAGNDQAANKGVSYIQKTYPASPRISLFGGMEYQTKCPKCHGSGIVDVPCSRCSGRGKCAGCNGTGKIKRIGGSYDTCTLCRGSGQCPTCNGSGRQTRRCRHCGGTGTIMSRKLMKDAYLQLVQEAMASAAMQEQAITKRAYATKQAAKGLVEFEGRWMTRDEKQRELTAQTARFKAQQTEAELKLVVERRKEAEAQVNLLAEKKKEEDRHAKAEAQRVEMKRSGKLPTKEQWKQKVAANFSVSVNQISDMVSPDDFKKEMGDPDRTQTLGDRTYWYYFCSDGQIQMDINSVTLIMYEIMSGARINDY
ncbi:MAG: hypothetical protein EOM20_09210 [Spartobacteria bacterium]|nr:hypothetical protein [Spartobacteria bacterium]